MSDDREWIHEKALELRKVSCLPLVNTIRLIKWIYSGMPFLTPRAKAVLEVVEKTMEKCDRCKKDYSEGLCEMECIFAPIRKAWKSDK